MTLVVLGLAMVGNFQKGQVADGSGWTDAHATSRAHWCAYFRDIFFYLIMSSFVPFLCNYIIMVSQGGVKTELKKQIPSNSSEQPLNFSSEGKNEQKGLKDMVFATSIVDDNAFNNELQGLTDGFPGGEKGLQKNPKDNPPPAKQLGSSEMESMSLSKSKASPLPLVMPGGIVIVKNPKNPYHMYSGIVQRVTDGKAGVLFEGGNWDKLVTFKLEDLERRSKGPHMSNPKSAILENINIP